MLTRSLLRSISTSKGRSFRLAGSLQSNQAILCRHASSSTAGDKDVSSFVTSIFQAKPDTKYLFPYPSDIPSDDKDSLAILIGSVNRFFEEVNNPALNDQKETVPPETDRQLKELGLFGLQVPQELGGLGTTNTMYARLVEIVGRHDLGLAIYLGAHQSIGFKGILIAGNEEQKNKYLPSLASGEKIAAFALTEPSSGSDAGSIRTEAKLSPDGKHYILNGSKIWISNGGLASVFTVFAQTEVPDKNGVLTKKITAFIVERDFGGVTNGPPMKKMGIKCSNTAEVFFDNTPVPIENVIGKPGEGFKVAMNILNNGRFGMAAGLTGTMKILLEYATKHVTTRTQFDNKLMAFEGIKEKIAQMTLKTYATESTAYLLSGIMDKGAKEYQLEAAISKIFASESAWYVCDEAIQILGGMGYMKELPLERFQRDLRIFRIFEGTNDILRQFVALMGIKATGKALQKNPALLAQVYIPSRLLQFSPNSPKIASPRPQLEQATTYLNTAMTHFFSGVAGVTAQYREKSVEQQIKLRLIADAAISIYTMSAVISRADDAFKKNRSSANYEQKLATEYCRQNVESVLRDIEQLNVNNQVLREIADQTFTVDSGYLPDPPLDI